MRRSVFLIAAVLAASGRLARAQVSAEADHSAHAHVAQSGDAKGQSARLLANARNATQVYADRGAAIAAGYRRVGRDFPSMGEHWLNPRLLIEGSFDITRPSILTYVSVDGHATLTGLVYAIPLAPGEAAPAAFGPDAVWHEHNGTIEEEGLLPQHHTTPTAATGTRVAILHAWTRLPNPGGVFSAENWAIPFLRLALAVPAEFTDNSAKALSLLSGGSDYFRDMTGAGSAAVIDGELEACRASAEKIVADAKAAKHDLTASDIARLDTVWRRMLVSVSGRNPEAAQMMNGGEPVTGK